MIMEGHEAKGTLTTQIPSFLQLQTAYDTNFKLMVIRHAKEINRTEGTE
jgi:hypothetical protein